jgi:adenylate cyclase
LPDARAAIADGLRLLTPPGFVSLAAVRLIWAVQFRNAQDAAVVMDALQQAGLPEWPNGFTGNEQDRLKGEEIASLIFGHTLQGQLEPGHQPAFLQIGSDGKAAFRSMTRMFTGTVYVDRNLLCRRSENMFGRPDCGPVYKRTDDAGNDYTFVNSTEVFHFAVVQ